MLVPIVSSGAVCSKYYFFIILLWLIYFNWIERFQLEHGLRWIRKNKGNRCIVLQIRNICVIYCLFSFFIQAWYFNNILQLLRSNYFYCFWFEYIQKCVVRLIKEFKHYYWTRSIQMIAKCVGYNPYAIAMNFIRSKNYLLILSEYLFILRKYQWNR